MSGIVMNRDEIVSRLSFLQGASKQSEKFFASQDNEQMVSECRYDWKALDVAIELVREHMPDGAFR